MFWEEYCGKKRTKNKSNLQGSNIHLNGDQPKHEVTLETLTVGVIFNCCNYFFMFKISQLIDYI